MADMTTLTKEQAVKLLTESRRDELRDHAFGDREIYWVHPVLGDIAEGYSGGGDVSISVVFEVGDRVFGYGSDDRELLKLGQRGRVERNDSTGPDEYLEGVTMPGLTKEGVLKELLGT